MNKNVFTSRESSKRVLIQFKILINSGIDQFDFSDVGIV